jgi:hypothetical protein
MAGFNPIGPGRFCAIANSDHHWRDRSFQHPAARQQDQGGKAKDNPELQL